MAIPKGARLGRYEIRSLLGAGGMGEVYLAEDLTLHRQVAVKVLRADLTMDRNRLKRFEREAHAASSLNHPNILTIFEIGHENEYHFIVTEFIEGESLGKRIERGGFEVQELLDIGIQIASALTAAHTAGIVHRDIKPDNAMLRRDRLVKVLDFGIAKLSDPSSDPDTQDTSQSAYATNPGAVIGTPRFMSPEQARGVPVDARSDIWSLGVVLYKMATGALPFTGETTSDVLVAILTADPPALLRCAPYAPPELDHIVMKTLRKDPAERYQAVKDLELDLKTLKRRLAFEAELERSGGWIERSSESAKEATSPHLTGDETLELVESPTAGVASHTKPSPVASIKRNKPFALLMLAMLVAVTAAFLYFAYSRFIARSGGKAAITSMAVLPFRNVSNDPEKEYLSDGIAETLINRLSQLPELKVIANTSSSKYKGRDADPQDVARALDVQAIVTGRVSLRGDNLVISVELVSASDRTQLWGEQYNRKTADLNSVPAEISGEIAQRLRLRLTADEQRGLATREEVNSEAYELLLKGRFYYYKGGAENRKKALEYFNQAIAVDPGYAAPYAELSNTYRSLMSSSILDPREYLAKAEAAAQKALDLDENLADAHYVLASLKAYRWEWEDAERYYQRAIELNPNLALARRYYAAFLNYRGRHEQALEEIKRARELDPLSINVHVTVGHILCNARQYDRAIEFLLDTLELDRSYSGAYWFLGYCYPAKGMYAEAIAAFEQAIKLGQDTPGTQIRLGAAYAHIGNRARAQAILKQLLRSKEYVSPFELGILYAALGEPDQAFASLEKAYKAHDLQFQFLGVSPEWDSLRSDPRFQDLLRRVGLIR